MHKERVTDTRNHLFHVVELANLAHKLHTGQAALVCVLFFLELLSLTRSGAAAAASCLVIGHAWRRLCATGTGPKVPVVVGWRELAQMPDDERTRHSGAARLSKAEHH